MRKSVEQTTDMHCFFNVPQNLNFLAGQDGQDIKKNGSQRCSTETVTVLAPALTAIWAD